MSQVRGAGRLNVAALRSAVRAAIVIPAVFALTDKVIAQPQVSLLAAFGSFAIVVFTEFAGTWRARLLAYASLGAVGALYITLGTLCSRTPWIGAVVMAAVGFATLFSGVLGGYFAAGATGAILTFVLPVTIPVGQGYTQLNLDPAKDMHMHEATIELVTDDHIRSTWTMYTGGKPDHSTTFDLQRKK